MTDTVSNTDAIDRLPPLRKVIADYDLRAEKSLGQNFLLDGNITDKIARAAGIKTDDVVVEIGPGPGGLTRSLLRVPIRHLHAIEMDPRCILALEPVVAASNGRLTLQHGDAMKIDYAALTGGQPFHIVANLPYKVATPLLLNWLRIMRDNPALIASMTLMFQKEVADRIMAVPGNKSYGRLSVMAGWLCDIHKCLDLPPTAFTPAPKVYSAVIQLRPKPNAHTAAQPDFAAVEKIVAQAFNQRRKMIRSPLKEHIGILQDMGIDTTLRAENLDIQTYIELARRIS